MWVEERDQDCVDQRGEGKAAVKCRDKGVVRQGYDNKLSTAV